MYEITKKFSITTDMNISYYRPLKLNAEVIAEVEIPLGGNKLQIGSCKFFDSKSGKLCAEGRHTKMVVPIKKIANKKQSSKL